MNRLMIGGAATALLVAMTPASAQVPPPPGVAQGTAPAAPARPPMIAPMKRTETRVMVMSNQTMTRDQVAAHVRKFFERLDANHDGYLTRDELGAMGQHAMMMRNGTMMRGGMGMHAMAMRGHDMPMPDRGAMFDRLDVNHDGNISRQEFMAAKPVREERRVIMMRDGKGGPAPMPGMENMDRMKVEMHGMDGMRAMHGMPMGFGGRLFDMADANKDGRVSLAEAQAMAMAHFDKADLNHDGKITPDERRQVHVMMRERRQS